MVKQKNTFEVISVAKEREKLPSRNALSLWRVVAYTACCRNTFLEQEV